MLSRHDQKSASGPETTLANREKEINDIHAVLDELAAGIHRELDDAKAPEQIEL